MEREGLLEICELRDKMNSKLGGKYSRTIEIVKEILELNPEHTEFHAKQQKLIHNNNLTVLEGWFQKRQGNNKSKQIKLEIAQKI